MIRSGSGVSVRTGSGAVSTPSSASSSRSLSSAIARLFGRVALEEGDTLGHLALPRVLRRQRRKATALALKVERSLGKRAGFVVGRSEEHTSELQSLMRISYAVF